MGGGAGIVRPRLERGNRRQFLAFAKLQERTAAGGDVRHRIGDAVFVDGGQGVAAAGDRECRRLRDGTGEGLRAVGEGIALEHTDRAVPDHRAGGARSEEHTYELTLLMRTSYAVFCLKKKTQTNHTIPIFTVVTSSQT